MSGVATAIAGSAVLGAVVSSNAASKAAKASQAGSDASTAEQRRQYDLTRSDYAPYRQVGTGALNKLASLYGISQYQTPDQSQSDGSFNYSGGQYGQDPYGAVNSGYFGSQPTVQLSQGSSAPQASSAPDYSGFYSSPDYAFARSEGLRGVEQSAAARGGAFSGNALRGLTDYSSGLASQQYGNYFNRLSSLAGIGQSATGSTAQAGSNAANSISQGMMASGDARASGIMGAANGTSSALNSGVNNYLLYKGGYFNKGP